MKKKLKKILKITAVTLLTLITLQGAVAAYLCYQLSEDKLPGVAQDLLTSILETEVRVERAAFHPMHNSIAIYGFHLKDQQHQDLLHVDTLTAHVSFLRLLKGQIMVRDLYLAGAQANLYKAAPQSAPNYQFVLEALPFQGNEQSAAQQQKEKGHHKPLILDLRSIVLSRTSAQWNIHSEPPLNTPDHKELDMNHLWVHDLALKVHLQSGGYPGSFVGKLDYLHVDEHNSQSKIEMKDIKFDDKSRLLHIRHLQMAYQDKRLDLKHLRADYSRRPNADSVYISVPSIEFENGIGVPRPKRSATRGAFDPKHVRLKLSLRAAASYMSNDSIAVQIHQLQGKEENSRLSLDHLTFALYKNRSRARIDNLHLQSGRNKVSTPHIHVTLPTYGKHPTPLTFRTDKMHIHALLQDLSHTFAPALAQFTTPLSVTTTAQGNNREITLRDIHVATPDGQLTIQATGHFYLPEHKGQRLTMQYDVAQLKATNNAKQRILAHFVKSQKALQFLSNIGPITFRGTVRLPYQQQHISGILTTPYGPINANVVLDSRTAYMTGSLAATDFQLGTFLANPNLGPVSVEAKVKMDISGKAKARQLHRAKGKIPQGTLSGTALTACYKGIYIHNVDFHIENTAHGAHGTLGSTGRLMDLSCDFTFTYPDIRRTLSAKPHVKLHNPFKKKKGKRKKENEK